MKYDLSLGDPATGRGILDLEGVVYNFVTKILAVCGGKQVQHSCTKTLLNIHLFNYLLISSPHYYV